MILDPLTESILLIVAGLTAGACILAYCTHNRLMLLFAGLGTCLGLMVPRSSDYVEYASPESAVAGEYVAEVVHVSVHASLGTIAGCCLAIGLGRTHRSSSSQFTLSLRDLFVVLTFAAIQVGVIVIRYRHPW